MQIEKRVSEEAVIQRGDFVGVALKHSARVGMKRANIVGMMGKVSKMANGKMMTHVAGSEVNLDLLAVLAGELCADDALRKRIRNANTARGVLVNCFSTGHVGIYVLCCQRAVE